MTRLAKRVYPTTRRVDPSTRLANRDKFGLAGQQSRPKPDTITCFVNPKFYPFN
jgi:hypothetical protein